MKKNKRRGISIYTIVSKPDFPRHLEKLFQQHLTDIDDINLRNQLYAAYMQYADRGIKYSESQREKSKKTRSTISTENGVLNKKTLIKRALSEAGEGANTHEVMNQLFGILDKEGMQPEKLGAKNFSSINALDAQEKLLTFSYSNVQKTLTQLRGASAVRGRPRKKQK